MREQRTWITRGVGVTLLSIALLVGLAGTASAATLIGSWKLKGNLKNTAGTAVTMTKVGDVAFETVDVNGTARQALVFDASEGLRLTRVPTNARSWVRQDAVNGFRRIMSFGPNEIDEGLYTVNGDTHLYDVADSDTQDFVPDTWVRVHLTRDARTNRVKVYVDGTQVLSYKDHREAYRLFLGRSVPFQDDGSEHSSGYAASVKLWRGVKAP